MSKERQKEKDQRDVRAKNKNVSIEFSSCGGSTH